MHAYIYTCMYVYICVCVCLYAYMPAGQEAEERQRCEGVQKEEGKKGACHYLCVRVYVWAGVGVGVCVGA